MEIKKKFQSLWNKENNIENTTSKLLTIIMEATEITKSNRK